MFKITKDEAKYLREHGVTEGLAATMRTKSQRKKFYAAEEHRILELLENYRRNVSVRETYPVQ
ncbi:MAG: hypothetical protein NC485_12295 [Ruminococcus flavefaciens]|nr:hypothetical protein [Ruminococcus flavefaciens]MCM1060099.1 hypothetical protein [Eubacterium sp.]